MSEKSGGLKEIFHSVFGLETVEDNEDDLLEEEAEEAELNEDIDDAEDYDEVQESVQPEEPKHAYAEEKPQREMPRMKLTREKPAEPKRAWGFGSVSKWQSSGRIDRVANNSKKVVNLQAQVKMDLTIESPENFEEARELCLRMQKKQPIVVDFECLDLDRAQRLTDFLCGACYALNGDIKQISNKVFLMVPDNMDINADEEFCRTLKSEGGIGLE